VKNRTTSDNISPLNRRELLTSFLGLPVAMTAGCVAGPTTLPPEGRIVGGSADIGHRLRDGMRPSVPDHAWTDIEVVIVGGGIAGLSAARKLQQSGIDSFVLLELEQQPGGTSVSGQSELISYPWGAHYLPVPLPHNESLIRLLDEMGLVEDRDVDGSPRIAEHYLCRAPQERVFYKGFWYEGLFLHADASPRDLQQLQDFQQQVHQLVDWRDDAGRRAFTIPAAECSQHPRMLGLDALTMSDWLKKQGFSSERLWKFIDYACRDDYGLTVEQTSAWAGLFYFASRVGQSGRESQPFITWPEGNGRIVAHLAALSEQQIQSGWAVTAVEPGVNNADRITVTAFQSDTAAVRGWRARHVIFAAPPFLAPYLIPELDRERKAAFRSFEFGSWLVANLHLTDRPQSTGFPLSWDNVLYESPSLGYVAATHQRGMDFGPTVLTYYYPLCDDDPQVARQRLLSLSWDEWADVVLSDLERAHPEIRTLCRRLDIMRWGHAMVRPRPGFITGAARRISLQAYRGIHFAHSALSGLALFEEAFYHGERAAGEIMTVRNTATS